MRLFILLSFLLILAWFPAAHAANGGRDWEKECAKALEGSKIDFQKEAQIYLQAGDDSQDVRIVLGRSAVREDGPEIPELEKQLVGLTQKGVHISLKSFRSWVLTGPRSLVREAITICIVSGKFKNIRLDKKYDTDDV